MNRMAIVIAMVSVAVSCERARKLTPADSSAPPSELGVASGPVRESADAVTRALASLDKPNELSDSMQLDTIAIEPMGIQVAAACFRSPHSVLFGPPTPSGQQGTGPGWVGLQVPTQGDSGWAKLVDANSKAFHGFWRRDTTDSVAFAVGDHLLRVKMRVTVSDTLVIGSASAHSDATLEPNAAGRLVDIRREWTLRAVRSPCDSMPAG
jgi:hypothetical protein